jgi:hypothetical protein
LSRIGVLAVVISALMPTVQAPLLTSPAFASPVTIHWTPPAETTPDGHGESQGHGHGHGHGHGKGSGGGASLQLVLRAEGPCGTAAGVRMIATFTDPATSDFSDPVTDGTYCYSIEAADDSTAAVSPGLTVVVGAQGVAVADWRAFGQYKRCQGYRCSSFPGQARHQLRATNSARVPVTVRWKNPAVPDLARVELVMNGKHPPHGLFDGRVVYRGLEQSFVLVLKAGQTAHLALYAIDQSGNISAASRTVISLAALIPMR